MGQAWSPLGPKGDSSPILLISLEPSGGGWSRPSGLDPWTGDQSRAR